MRGGSDIVSASGMVDGFGASGLWRDYNVTFMGTSLGRYRLGLIGVTIALL
jgi:hypothetical protein